MGTGTERQDIDLYCDAEGPGEFITCVRYADGGLVVEPASRHTMSGDDLVDLIYDFADERAITIGSLQAMGLHDIHGGAFAALIVPGKPPRQLICASCGAPLRYKRAAIGPKAYC